jgi:hypothetical protein
MTLEVSLKHTTNDSSTHPPPKDTPSTLPLGLQCCFQRIDWGEYHSKEGSGSRSKDGLDILWECAHKGITFQERKDSGVGGGVTKPSDRALHKGCSKTLVVPGKATVCVEGTDGLRSGGSVSVLIVHDRSKWLLSVNNDACILEKKAHHKGEDLKHHR